MPIYEYTCTECNQDVEALQKVGDAPLQECPHCHRASLTKKISAPPFHLKGTGWYVTDFRDKDKAKKPETTATSTESAEKKESPEKTSDITSSDTAITTKTED